MNDARTDILARIRAVRPAPAPAPVRAYRRTGTLDAEARLALFCERVADYRADVRRVPDLAAAVAAACTQHGARRLGVPPGLPAHWRPPDVELVPDHDLSPHELDTLDAVLTGSTLAVAETGTIALAGSPTEGRRALTLVPDLHLCVVREDQIVETVPEAIAALAELVARERRPITLVSGPSATSDIELDRVEGVHGPRTLVVLVVPKELP